MTVLTPGPVFAPGLREQMHARIALSGPAGSGKTKTSFILARALSPDGRFAVIDTDRRAREYGLLPTDDPAVHHPDRFRFGHMIPDRADPAKLPGLLASAASEGYGALVLDSFSHYWSGLGGALDRVDRSSDKRAGWSDYRPIETAMMKAILDYPGHVLVTMRVKTEHVIEENGNGRRVSRRVGLKPDQRDNVDYEFSIMGEMDDLHTLTIVKTTCPDLVDKRIPRPGLELAATLQDWLGLGTPPPPVPTAQQVADLAIGTAMTADELGELYRTEASRGRLAHIVIDECSTPLPLGALLGRLGTERRAAEFAALQQDHALQGAAA